jgi:hypothetical protein
LQLGDEHTRTQNNQRSTQKKKKKKMERASNSIDNLTGRIRIRVKIVTKKSYIKSIVFFFLISSKRKERLKTIMLADRNLESHKINAI